MAGRHVLIVWLLIQLVAWLIVCAYLVAAIAALFVPPILCGYWAVGWLQARRG